MLLLKIISIILIVFCQIGLYQNKWFASDKYLRWRTEYIKDLFVFLTRLNQKYFSYFLRFIIFGLIFLAALVSIELFSKEIKAIYLIRTILSFQEPLHVLGLFLFFIGFFVMLFNQELSKNLFKKFADQKNKFILIRLTIFLVGESLIILLFISLKIKDLLI